MNSAGAPNVIPPPIAGRCARGFELRDSSDSRAPLRRATRATLCMTTVCASGLARSANIQSRKALPATQLTKDLPQTLDKLRNVIQLGAALHLAQLVDQCRRPSEISRLTNTCSVCRRAPAHGPPLTPLCARGCTPTTARTGKRAQRALCGRWQKKRMRSLLCGCQLPAQSEGPTHRNAHELLNQLAPKATRTLRDSTVPFDPSTTHRHAPPPTPICSEGQPRSTELCLHLLGKSSRSTCWRPWIPGQPCSGAHSQTTSTTRAMVSRWVLRKRSMPEANDPPVKCTCTRHWWMMSSPLGHPETQRPG